METTKRKEQMDMDAEFPVAFEDCEKMGGHCWLGNEALFAVYNESALRTVHEKCKHCGATRIGTMQPSIRYTEPRKCEEPELPEPDGTP